MNRKFPTVTAAFAVISLCLSGGAALAQSRPTAPEAVQAVVAPQAEAARATPSPRASNLQIPAKKAPRVATRDPKKLAGAPAAPVSVASAQEPITTATIPAKPKSPLFWMTVGSGF